MPVKLTQAEVLLKFKKTHGNTYDYSLVEYKGSNKKVKIICKKHGVFKQVPASHLYAKGCFKCGKEMSTKILKLSLKEVLQRFKKVHGNKYDYSKVKYVNAESKVKIKCKIHKEYFTQSPVSHWRGNGCRKCGIITQTKKVLMTFFEFEKKASKLHNNLYTYHQDYINSREEIKITCQIHGIFKQSANSHLCGAGCPYCAGSNTQNEIFNLISKVTRLKLEYNIYLAELCGLELDLYNKRKKIAIEYQGESHYLRYSKDWGYFKIENILNTQKRDRKKKYLCRKYGIRLVIIPCYQWNKLKTTIEKRKYLREKLSEF